MKKGLIVRLICFPLIAVMIVAVIIGDVIAMDNAQSLTGILCPPIVDEEALLATRESGQKLSTQILQEGSVLLKNDNILPLSSSIKKVNVFGWSSTDWVYGGSGSGQVRLESGNEKTDLLSALEQYGVEYNTELVQMYSRYLSPVGDIGSIGTLYNSFYKLAEPSITDKSYYDDALLTRAKSFSDTALVVISRRTGETEDPTVVQYKHKSVATDTSRHFLEITTEEEGLLKYAGENYANVVVIVNSINVMQLGFMDTIPGLDACLLVGGTGTNGAIGIPSILYGDVSPSGRLVDTFPYDLKSNINHNFSGFDGVGHYTNGAGMFPIGISNNTGVNNNPGSTARVAPAYVDYVEGIYVGYKWYETADKEGVWSSDTLKVLGPDGKTQVTRTGYEAVVQYPFGYGMSYTNFDWAVEEVTPAIGSKITENSEISITVRVTNNGTRVGKEVVQVYLTAPYTSGGIEKSYVSLVGFAKTADIAPNNSQTVKIVIDAEDLASYDCYNKNNNGFAGYEIEAGTYELKLMTDSHNIKTVDFDNGAKGAQGVIDFKVDTTIKLETDKYSGEKVTNKFTDKSAVNGAIESSKAIDGASLDGSDSNANIPFITRADFPRTLSKTADRAMTDNIKKYNLYTLEDVQAWDSATVDAFGEPVDTTPVIFGKSGNLKVYDNGKITDLGYTLGADFDAPEWDDLLDQITLSEARSLIGSGTFSNGAVASIGKPRLTDYDGPVQVKSFNAPAPYGTGFPCATVIAQTWSSKLAYDFGLNYAKEMEALGVDGVYGFGINMHRNAFAGRNFEYYSEDSFISGVFVSNIVRAVKNGGKYAYVKHFALNEVESERESLYTWLSEQALREIYLKPFQMAVQEGGAVGIMTPYNRIGHVWGGGSEALIVGVLRKEWGFNGTVLTDYSDHAQYQNLHHALRAGGDLGMGVNLGSTWTGGYTVDYTTNPSPRLRAQMREACHHIVYMWLNAKYTNSVYNATADVGEQIINKSTKPSWEWWRPVLVDINIFIFAGCGFAIFFLIPKKKSVKTA